ncbi:MAG: phospholipid carrier-dependent glycosyltransferase [Acidobacteriota bacterium]|nr:phospholipid carrier-dependent glycosyltransferase [Acidobacteriota bacterium]
MILQSRQHLVSITTVVAIFLSLVVASSLTNRPQIDEGMFASPALNLAENGHFGTTVLETENSPLTRIDQRTYWVMPLFLLNVSASFKAFGANIFTMRLVSIFWGLVLLAAWYFIVLKLSGNRNVALVCLALLACDYTILDTASLGRMDMMSAALGFAAVAVYLMLRERNLPLAVGLSQTLVVLNGLTHPNGILAFFGLAFLTLYFDFRKLAPRYFALAAVPYLIGGAAFGFWVLQDAQAFRDQFIDNAMMSGRTSGLSSPVEAIFREFTDRYPHAYGLGFTSSGHGAVTRLKSLILIGYIAGFLGVVFTPSLRRKYFALLVMWAIYFVIMAILDGQKETPYLVHIVPFYVAFLAITVNELWQRKLLPKPSLVAALVLFAALQTGGLALRVRKNTYANLYQPAIDFLRQNAGAGDSIMGGAGLGFGLNFPENFTGDGRYGMTTGKRPKFIVYSDDTHLTWIKSKILYPEFHEYLPRMLERQYEVVYQNEGYKIYARREAENSAPTATAAAH